MLRCGRFVILRPDEAAPSDGLPIRILPNGTGHRVYGAGWEPSTQAMLEALPESLAGQTVSDVGTGSGILAIAAALLGAAHVHASDILPRAVERARANVELNGLQGRIQVELRDGPPGILADWLLCSVYNPRIVRGLRLDEFGRNLIVQCGQIEPEVSRA